MNLMTRLADEIAQSDCRHAFGIPGGGLSLELIDELERRGVAFHLTHTEASATLMAGTAGHLEGHAGVAIGIKGPGLANMIPGLTACHFECLPVVAFAEAYDSNTGWQYRHKGLDHHALVSAVAKGHGAVGPQGTFGRYATLAEAEAPGPVVVDLVEGGEAASESAGPPESKAREVVEAISTAQRPVVIAGTLAARAGWRPHLTELAVPVFTTAAAKGVLDETLAHAAGVYTGAGLENAPEISILGEADLVVGLGLRSGEVLSSRPFAVPAVNVDSLPSEPPFKFVSTTTDKNIDSVIDSLKKHAWGLEGISESRQLLNGRLLGKGFLPAHAFMVLERHFAGNVRLVLDTGNFCTIAEHVWRAREFRLCLMSGQGRYMGTSIPMALAASLFDSTVPTVSVVGDGGIGMYLADVRLAVRHRLPLLIVLMTDAGFGSIRTRAQADGLTQSPLNIAEPSWLSTFESLGFPVTRASSEQALADVLAEWVPADGPAYIEIPFELEAYGSMVDGVR